ncbi:M50 family metallopeptidase [Cryobacterium breve]|uniref:M50 family metallopeptidase n=1 Tax=Cryobacterium breve TaxID=1259258 RepID=A0ABY7NDW1_9MICO|nr:M50 family metallopeptidase [Cryobacterium breve]WBM80469.1 M50 family metallopeptidase [Cryobacterium breve]
MDFLLVLWARLTERQDPLPLPIAWLTIAAAAAIVLVPVLWHPSRNVVTIAHEGGHALVATLGGRQLGGIRLHSDTSGLTVSRGKPRGIGMVLTLLAGYTAPAVLGLCAAWLLSLGYSAGLLWLLLAALALLLVQVRNWFGLWSVLLTSAVIFVITWYGSALVQSVFALLVTAFLLLGAVRTVLELQQSRARRAGAASDADQLARLTHVPGLLWVGVFLVVTVGCAVVAFGVLGLAG